MFKATRKSFKLVLAIILTMFCTGIVIADMPPPEGFHRVTTSAFFSKAESAGGLVLVGQEVLGDERSRDVINGTYIRHGYKFNEFRLWAIDSSYFNTTTLSNLPLVPDSSDHERLWLTTDSNGYSYPNLISEYWVSDTESSPIRSQVECYVISKQYQDVYCELTRIIGYDSLGVTVSDINYEAIDATNLKVTPVVGLTLNNYFDGLWFASAKAQDVTVSIVNVRGQTMMRVQKQCMPMYQNVISLSHLPAGVYVAEVRGETQRVTGKICLMR